MNATAQTRPYPIPPMTAAAYQAATLGRQLRGLIPRADPEVAVRILRKLLDAPVSWHWDAPVVVAGSDGPNQLGQLPDPVSFRIALASAGHLTAARLHLPRGPAQALADRIVGGPWPATPAPLPALDGLSRGALAYAIARTLASLGGEYRLLDTACDAPPDSAPQLASGSTSSGSIIQWSGRVDIGAVAVPVCIDVPETWRAHVGPARVDLRRFGDLVLEPFVCGGTSQVSLRELTRLGPGDVLVCDVCSLPDGLAHIWLGGQPLRGIALHCKGSELEVTMVDNTRTSVRPPGPEAGPSQPPGDDAPARRADPTEAVLALAGDAPVMVALEVTRLPLTLQQLAGLQAGDVLRSQHPVGAPITLRVGDRAIARGELVEIDGEAGVRVTQVLGPRSGVDPQP